jgi:hypothetical protein
MTASIFQFSAVFEKQRNPIPAVGGLLATLGDTTLFYAEQGLRHPLGIYNQSLTKIGKRAVELLTKLARTIEDELAVLGAGQSHLDALLDANDHFLDALIEHVDDCKAVLKGVLGPEESYRAISAFGKAIEPYRNHIGAIVNLIKHQQAAFSPVQFSWPGNICIGYFVATVNDGLTVGPSRIIHRDGNSGFSFNRDIPFHLCGIFFVGEKLRDQLVSSRPILRSLGSESAIGGEKSSEAPWTRALLMSSQLPRVFFPDEIRLSPPLISVDNNRVRVTYAPSPFKRAKPPPSGAKVSVSFSGDGVTKSFKMPYFGSQKAQ